jgi:hypothetical protein
MYAVDERAIEAMRGIIEYFLQRQTLVARAMLEVHPQPLRMYGTHIFGVEIAPCVERWRRRIATDDNFRFNWQSGVWGGEWRHFAHGYGCRLTHIHTGEPLEWDAPDLLAFDEYWFGNHLTWRIQQTLSPDQVEAYSQWLWSIFQHMQDQQIIVLTPHYKWKLA